MAMGYCQSCGAALKLGAKFCSLCGAEVPAMPRAVEPVREGLKVYSPKVITILAFAVLGAFGIYLARSTNFGGEDLASDQRVADFTLIEENRRGVIFRSMIQEGDVFAYKLFSESKNNCTNYLISHSDIENCIIFFLRQNSKIDDRQLARLLTDKKYDQYRERVWKDEIIGFYAFDPDNSSGRKNPDELFIIDCKYFKKDPEIKWIICKGGPEDPISSNIVREKATKEMEAERMESMAADAEAVAREPF
jgi:hypothetical protein